MKKFFAVLLAAVMLASLSVLCVSATEDDADWAPFGKVEAQCTENLSEIIELDGDVSDWQANSELFEKQTIDKYNLDAWVGEVDEDWYIDMWFGADNEFLYIAFKINDDNVCYSDDEMYNGDAFQIQLDFNGWAAGTQAFRRAVFYSFGLQDDETLDVTVQCIADDDAINYTMASDDEPEWRMGHVEGATKKAEDGSGWFAEFAISWQTLYNDISQKMIMGEEDLPEWTGGEDEISLNMLVAYIDRNETDGAPVGAWATSNALGAMKLAETDNGCGWFPENSGMVLTLSGMSGVVVKAAGETTEEPTTEAPTTEDVTTEAPTTQEKTEAPTTKAPEQTTAAESEGGCGGIIGVGAIVAVLALGVCVVAKKKD